MENQQQMQMFQQLMQNPQMLQRLQDPAIRGQLAQQLAGQFSAPPQEAMQGLGGGQPPQVGMSNPQQQIPPSGPPQGGAPQGPTPFLQGMSTPIGSGIPIQYDRNGVPQTPFLPQQATPNQAPFVPAPGGPGNVQTGMAQNAFSQASGLVPGGIPQGQGGGLPEPGSISPILAQYYAQLQSRGPMSPFQG